MADPTPDPVWQQRLMEAVQQVHARMNLRRLGQRIPGLPQTASPSRNLDEQRQLQQVERETK